MEGRCGSSSTPAVAPGMHYLSILAEHVPGSQVVAIVDAALTALALCWLPLGQKRLPRLILGVSLPLLPLLN